MSQNLLSPFDILQLMFQVLGQNEFKFKYFSYLLLVYIFCNLLLSFEPFLLQFLLVTLIFLLVERSEVIAFNAHTHPPCPQNKNKEKNNPAKTHIYS